MLNLYRKGNTIEVKFDYHITYGGDWNSMFTNSVDNEHHAQLMYAHLKETLEAAVIKARREAYEEGWKDKSSKKAKKDWFSCQL